MQFDVFMCSHAHHNRDQSRYHQGATQRLYFIGSAPKGKTQKQIPIIRQQTSAIAESYRLSLIDEFDHNNRIKKKKHTLIRALYALTDKYDMTLILTDVAQLLFPDQ